MANIGIFDVLGPIMIGPSSSHTAGAARLGKIARTIVNKPIKKEGLLFKRAHRGRCLPSSTILQYWKLING